MDKIAEKLTIPDYETLLGVASSYCDRLLKRSEHTPVAAAEPETLLPEPAGIRLVLWDIYGTLFATRAGDLEGSLSVPEAMLGAFELTAAEFSFDSLFNSPAAAALWTRERYLQLIGNDQREKKRKNHSLYPEVRIELIWNLIAGKLHARGWQPPSGDAGLLPYRIALFYEIAFQQAVIYTAAWPVLNRIREQGFAQGLVSNAQFYTPLLLHYFINRQSGGECATPWEIFDPGLCSFSYQPELSKPDQSLFTPVLEEAGLRGISPGEILYVGNDMFNDVHGAAGLGLRTALFAADSGSLKLRRGNPAADSAVPDAVVTDFCQLPHILSAATATGAKRLKMAVWHYHFRPGGVTSVVRDTLAALAESGLWDSYEITLLASESESGGWPGWIGALSEMPGMSVRMVDLPALAYEDQVCGTPLQFEGLAKAQYKALKELIDCSGCSAANPFVLYAHNPCLGKNQAAAAAVGLLAQWAEHEKLPLVVLNQSHDFAELHRPDRIRAWRAATCLGDAAQARLQLPEVNNMVHASLTGLDRQRLLATGLESRSVFILPNSVRPMPGRQVKKCPALAEKLGGERPYLLAAQKVMRRKNTLELLLATAAVRAGGFDTALVVTLPAASASDRQFERLVLHSAAVLKVPAVIGVRRTLGEKAPAFEQVLAGSCALVSASVMEGFGMGFLEGWVAGRPVLGRWLDGPCDDFTASGVELGHLYRALLIDPEWLPGGLAGLSGAYREATAGLRRELGFAPQDDREFEEEFTRCKTYAGGCGRVLVDFGDLSERMQAGLLERLAEDSGGALLGEILELNPLLGGWRALVENDAGLVERNREAALRGYGPAIKARRMQTLIRAAAARLSDPARDVRTPEGGPRTLTPLLRETVSPGRARLLYL